MFIKAAAIVIASLTVTPVEPTDKPAETVTITVELAEKLVQSKRAMQIENNSLKYEIYQYQMLLHEARTKMCA